MLKEIKDIIEKAEHNFYGIRVMSENPETGEKVAVVAGDILDNSYDWDDSGNSLGIELNGACALQVNGGNIEKIMDEIKAYCSDGDQVVLIGSESAENGQDPYEIIMEDAEALLVIS